MTGQGGWPMTVFLTPTAEPFFCGTYFPPRPRAGCRRSRQVLESLAEAWRTKREQIDEIGTPGGRRSSARQRRRRRGPRSTSERWTRAVAAARGRASTRCDGGFGGAPKFPPSMVLEFLLRHHARTGDERRARDGARTPARRWRAAACTTSSPAASRGTRGRAVGRAALREDALRQRAAAARSTPHCGDRPATRWPGGSPRRRPSSCSRELRTAEGGFASALDADTEGEEGAVLRLDAGAAAPVLGEDDADWVDRPLRASTGTFEHGTSVLQLRRDPDDPARWQRSRPYCATPGAPGPTRAATTRWWPPGTVWRSPRSRGRA